WEDSISLRMSLKGREGELWGMEGMGSPLVKSTGSVRYTRLDSLLMEAAMTWEFTAMVLFRPTKSLSSFMVAFSVLRNRPKLL
uniref:Uncharacterized protein n=1 Tax=Gopherus agassizii TaxID=38772 RepID=A0A452H2M1_9SAUR